MRARLKKATLLLASLSMIAAAPPVQTAGAGYTPEDKDERGIWMQMEEAERELKHSKFVIRDPGLNNYVQDVFCRTVGEVECKDVRIYLMRTPYFNASMAPNGMMQVYSGLLLRVRSEAQLAAVLGHEFTHYQKRHSIQLFRKIKKNLGAAAFLGAILGPLATLGAIGGIFTFSREMESEADFGSIPLLVKGGYDPMAASLVWEQLRAEMDATALARGKKSRKDKNGGMFATHPPTAERMASLKKLADSARGNGELSMRRAEYLAALAPFWPDFIDDQVKLNDFGATEFLLESLAREGWTADLYYGRGELYRTRGRPEDLLKAAEFFRLSIGSGNAPAEAWRGLGLVLLRSGATAEGKAALKQYLVKRPDAPDKAMISSLAEG